MPAPQKAQTPPKRGVWRSHGEVNLTPFSLFGTSRYAATEFTFFLAIPVMFGASLLKMVKFGWHYTGAEILIMVVGMATAFVVSIASIKFLLRYIKNNDFKAFGWYRIVLGIIVIAYLLLIGDPTQS